MFGGKKKRNILENGVQAQAIVIGVRDTGVTINENPRVELTLQVRPDGATPFEAKKKVTVSRVSIPRPGDGYWVRFDPADPTEIEFDTERVAEINAAAEASVAEAAASQVPADLAQNGILGRGACVSVDKTPTGTLVDCALTVGVRLVDGTPSYRAQTHISLSPENAEKLIPGQTLFTVRADPNNHERIALSLNEPTPTVTVTDPSVLGPPTRALAEGVPCTVTIVAFAQQFLATPDGQGLYATKVRVNEDGSEFQIFLPVPLDATALLHDGAQLPAKRLAAEPQVLTVDWAAARAVAAGAAVA